MISRNSWRKKINKNNKEKGANRKTILYRFLFVLLILIFGIVLFKTINNFFVLSKRLSTTEFSKDMAGGFEQDMFSVDYSSKEVFTILIMSDWEDADRIQVRSLSIVQIDRNSSEMRIISLPADVYFRPYEYGTLLSARHEGSLIRVRNLIILGRLQSPPTPLAYPFYQLQELLAMHFDAYIFFDRESLRLYERISDNKLPLDILESSANYEDLTDLTNQYWIDSLKDIKLISVLNNVDELNIIETNVSILDMYKIIEEIKKMDKSSIKKINLKDSFLNEVVDEKGKTVDLISHLSIDKLMSDFVGDVKIDREQARLEIFNGSGVNGLGSRYGRWISHLGIDVIRTGTAPGNQDKTIIYVTDKEKFAYTLRKLQTLWDDDVEIVEGRPDFLTTADIVLILGMDF